MPDNRRFGVQRDGQWLHYVGDCGAAARFLESRSTGTGWIIIMFFDALLRSFGQLILANNPISGAVVLAALCVAEPWAGLAAVVCTAIAVLAAAAAGQQRSAVAAGLASCTATLLGAATGSLIGGPLEGRVWTLLTFGAVVSVYVTSSMSTLVSAVLPPAWWSRPSGRSKEAWPPEPAPGEGPWPPLFALPYSILQIVLLLCLLHSEAGLQLNAARAGVTSNATEQELTTTAIPNTTLAPLGDVNATYATHVREFYDIDHLDWGQMFQGVLVSASRVVALEDAAVSAAVYIALLLYSPVAACSALAGAFLGSMAGVVLLDPPFTAVYRGIWGVNGMLSLWAISAHSFVLSWHSLAAGVTCATLAAGLQAALGQPLSRAGLPTLLLPHSLAALSFLLVASSARSGFVRPAVLSFPEKHKYDFWKQQEHEEDEESAGDSLTAKQTEIGERDLR